MGIAWVFLKNLTLSYGRQNSSSCAIFLREQYSSNSVSDLHYSQEAVGYKSQLVFIYALTRTSLKSIYFSAQSNSIFFCVHIFSLYSRKKKIKPVLLQNWILQSRILILPAALYRGTERQNKLVGERGNVDTYPYISIFRIISHLKLIWIPWIFCCFSFILQGLCTSISIMKHQELVILVVFLCFSSNLDTILKNQIFSAWSVLRSVFVDFRNMSGRFLQACSFNTAARLSVEVWDSSL